MTWSKNSNPWKLNLTICKHIHTLLQENKHLSEKVDDLENRSRRNNLRILGLPENDLVTLCEREIPEAL